jgi:4-amino-4-deoxy-L-arabinose transferase-like glycosyltransferase
MTRKPQRQWLVLAVLVALAGFLRFYKLDGQLWLDEVSALTGSYRNSFWQILTVFPEHFPHPLYEQLAHGSLVLFGESPFAIRLPAAIFGLANVFMFYRLSRRLSGEGEALLGAGLLAVSYHHIYFSQNARGYTLYLFLALVATDLLLSLLKEMRWRTALAYIGVAALAAYSQTAGIALAPGQLLVALVVVCSMRASERANFPKPWHLIAMFILTALLVLLLYAPIIGGNIGYTSAVAGDEAPVARSARIFDVIVEVLHGLVPTLSTGVILALVAFVCAIGAWDFLRRQRTALAMLIVPVLISFIGMVALGAALHSRYFLLALIVAYLLGTRGLVIMFQKIRPVSQVGWTASALGMATIVLAALPLLSYFSMPKQDYLGALREVRAAARPGDRTVGADLAAHVYQKYYAPDFAAVETLDDLLREEASGQAVWVITTFERIEAKRRPDLLARLHRQYQLVRILPASTGDGEMRIYHRTAAMPPG